MGKVIAVTNQKGGAGKTTTATALAAALQLKGFSVLFIDTDPQCNSTDTYQAAIIDTATLYDVLFEGEPAAAAIQHTLMGDILPSDRLMREAEQHLTKVGREYALKNAITPLKDDYDYIIIDTPLNLDIMIINALTFADIAVIPLTADRYALQGLAQIIETVSGVKQYTNSSLKVAGLLFTQHDNRLILSKEISESLAPIAKQLDTTVFDTSIRRAVAVKEAQTNRESLFSYAPDSTAAQDYMRFTEELLERGI